VYSGAFIKKLLHNHIIIKKKSISGDVNDEANFSSFFCFTRELNLYSPLTFSLILRANSNVSAFFGGFMRKGGV
jgi:hypothetical protein